MVTTQQQEEFRISKQDLFDLLKTTYPTEIGSKVFADVDYIRESDDDTSFMAITFKAVVT